MPAKPADGQAPKGLVARAVSAVAKAARAVADVVHLDFAARFRPADSGQEIDFSVDVGRDTVWSTQSQMAALFGVDQSVIARHIKNIYNDNELPDAAATYAEIALVQAEGSRQVTREVRHYNLDVILAVGYRVSGARATEFRRWASSVLKGYIEEGYALNGQRLEADPGALQNLALEVRAIRTSEKSMYQKVRETFSACAIDYDPSSETARRFFAYAQDAFHYGVSEQTAAQIILQRADASKPNMGMVALGNRQPTLADAKVAKNYMSSSELRSLEILGESWLLYAESISQRQIKVFMSRMLDKVGQLIEVNDYAVFPGYDQIKARRSDADAFAKQQLELFRVKTKTLSSK